MARMPCLRGDLWMRYSDMLKKRVIIGLSALAALALSGCGGSGSFTPPTLPGGTLNFQSGPATTSTITGSVVVPSTGGVTLTTSGGQSVVVPSGVTYNGSSTIPPNTNYVIIPAGTGYLNVAGSIPVGTEVSIDGVANSGITVGPTGLTTVAIAIPVPVGSTGVPVQIGFPNATLDTSRSLSIQKMLFSGRLYILISGSSLEVISPLPYVIIGVLPNNGQNAGGTTVNTKYGPGNNGRATTLFVDFGTGYTESKSVTIEKSAAFYEAVALDPQNVPATGVETVAFSVGDLP